MWNRLNWHLLAAVAILCFSSLAFTQETVGRRNRSDADKAQPTNNQAFDSHDFSGVWQLDEKSLTFSDQVPTMTPEGQAKFNGNKPGYGPRAVPPALGNDPEGNCDPLGFPRNVVNPIRPIEFANLPNRLVQFFQYHEVWRTIWLDGRELPKDPFPTWLGYSVGKWDGDTLVVETVGLDERTWLDHFGNPHSDQLRVEERYRRIKYDTIQLNMTLYDPKTYTQPWVSETKQYLLQPKAELVEELCVPSEEQAFNKRVRDRAAGIGDGQK
jgi:hypothetical protein